MEINCNPPPTPMKAKRESLGLRSLGSNVPHYGKLVAIGCLGDERYYWFIGKHGGVAMIPADALPPTKPSAAKGE